MGGQSPVPPDSFIYANIVIIIIFVVSVINSFIGVCTTSILIHKIRNMDDGRLRGSLILALIAFLLPFVILIGITIVVIYPIDLQRNPSRYELYVAALLALICILLPIALQIGSLSTISVGEDYKGLTKTVRNVVIAGLVFNSIILFTFVYASYKFYEHFDPILMEREQEQAKKAKLSGAAQGTISP